MQPADLLGLSASHPFKFGRREILLSDLLTGETFAILQKKFSSVPTQKLVVAIRETLRFLYLSAYSPGQIFFPGDKLIDDIWHALIVETASYRDLCNRLRPNTFLHHSGLPYDEYAKMLSAEQLHEEQFSWLASYVQNFSAIDEEGFAALSLAQSLCEHLECDRQGLNEFAKKLLAEAEGQARTVDFDFATFLKNARQDAGDIDSQPVVLERYLNDLVYASSTPGSGIYPFENSHLESVFGVSTALAFTFWQHLAACERLREYPDWQDKNSDLWAGLAKGQLKCGLATTHLARPQGPALVAHKSDQGYFVSGQVHWVCGWGLFDHLLIGFKCDDSILFAVVEFPGAHIDTQKESYKIEPQTMACLMGSATVEIEFKDFCVSQNQIVSARTEQKTAVPRPSQFLLPEIGIAKTCLREIEQLVLASTHPRQILVRDHLPPLKSRIDNLEQLKMQNAPLDRLFFVRDEINRDAVRLLALAQGANAIQAGGDVPRRQLELLLLDSVAQPPLSFERKIRSSSRGIHEDI